MPAGRSRAASRDDWLDAVAADPALGRLTARRQATVHGIARDIALCADTTTMTSRPTWTALQARSGRSRRTLARTLALLREIGLLGVVGTGASAGRTSAALTPTTSDGRPVSDADSAVYVLAVPSPLHLVDQLAAGSAPPAAEPPVNDFDTPGAKPLVSETHPPHARASEDPSEPLRGPAQPAAQARPSVRALTRQPGQPKTRATQQCPDERRLDQARQLQTAVPVLRRISDRHVAWAVKAHHLAGWTTPDLVWAIDHRPDDTPWPHDGADGVANVGAWLRYRLTPWSDDTGTVHRSPSQRRAADHALDVARARARREEWDRREREAAPLDSPVRAAAIAEIRRLAALAMKRRCHGEQAVTSSDAPGAET